MTEKNNSSIGNFLICDIQTEYAEQLLKVLSEFFDGEYQFYFFQDVEKAETFLEHNDADIIISCEEYEDKLSHTIPQTGFLVLTGNPEEMTTENNKIFRYQSSNHIITDIQRISGKKIRENERENISSERDGEPGIQKKKGKIRIRDEPESSEKIYVKGLIGIYSPVHRIGKTRFALRLGQMMAEQMPVLYLNLEGYSGRSYYFPDSEGADLGEVLYCMKQERGDHGLKISSMAGQIGGMDYILPMENEQDLRSVKGKEWIELFTIIREKCIYEAVILDLGESVDGIYEILRQCTRIYTPYIDGGAARAKLEQYENDLITAGYEDVLGKTVKRMMKNRKTEIRNNAEMESERTDVDA